MKKGHQAKSGKYRRFYNEVKRARAESELRMVTIISLAAEKDWRAAAFHLERRNPEVWGQRQKVDQTLRGDPKNPLAITGITPEQAQEELLRRLAETKERFLQAGDITIKLRPDRQLNAG